MLIANTGQSLVIMNLRTGEQVQLPPGQTTPVADSKISFIDDSAVLISLFNSGILVAYTDAGAAYAGFPVVSNSPPPPRRDAGNPSLLSITGTTDWKYLRHCDLFYERLNPGDNVEIEAIWTFPKTANAKIVSWGFGPSEAAFTQISSSSRNVNTEPTFVMRAKMWVHSLTEIGAHTSILTPFGNTTNDYTRWSCDLRDERMGLFLRGSVANTSETLLLVGYDMKINRK